VRSPLLVGQGEAPALPAPPFTLGVASGDPTADGVILWTRLAPEPQVAGGGMPAEPVRVTWEVAADEGFRRVLRDGRATARPEHAHSVHVDAQGLGAGREVFYRFRVGDHESPVGRSRTAPEGKASAMSFAFASCQDYENGFYSAHRHLAEDDVDVVFFLGDYIYERAQSTGRPRAHEGPEPIDLASYRLRYATYKADAELQAAHAAHPWVVTWDDHEFDNNYANASSQETPPAAEAEFRARRAQAYKVWWEHQPVRLPAPTGPDYRIHRTLDFGDLARFHVLDTRQYRNDQPCGIPGNIGGRCADASAPDATVLGADQEQWLDKQLRTSRARWNVLAQQVMVSPTNFAPSAPEGIFNLDQWDGYPAAQQRLFDSLGRRGVDNPIVLTGDIHSSWVNDIRADPADGSTPVVATELVGTSITSSFPIGALVESIVSTRPDVKYFNGDQRGYVRCDVDTKELRADFKVVSSIASADATLATDGSFTIEAGRPGAQPS